MARPHCWRSSSCCCAGCRAIRTESAAVGLAAPFEGAQRDLGYEALAAAKIAIPEQNEAGGWSGRPLTLVVLNDEGEPAQAVVAARKLTLDPSVIGVVGHWSRETTSVALPIYAESGMPLMIPSACAGVTFPEGIYRIAPDDEQIIAALLDYLKQHGVSARVAVAVEPDGLAEMVDAALRTTGFTIVPGDEPADVLVLALDDEATRLPWPTRPHPWSHCSMAPISPCWTSCTHWMSPWRPGSSATSRLARRSNPRSGRRPGTVPPRRQNWPIWRPGRCCRRWPWPARCAFSLCLPDLCWHAEPSKND